MAANKQLSYADAIVNFGLTLKGVERNCWFQDFVVVAEGFYKRNKAFTLADFLQASDYRGVPENQTLKMWRHFAVKMKDAGRLEKDGNTYRLI